MNCQSRQGLYQITSSKFYLSKNPNWKKYLFPILLLYRDILKLQKTAFLHEIKKTIYQQRHEFPKEKIRKIQEYAPLYLSKVNNRDV